MQLGFGSAKQKGGCMGRLRYFSVLVLLGLCVVAVPAFADTVFTDNSMNLGHYTTIGPDTSGFATATATNCGACGDPGAALQISESFMGAGTVQAGFLNNTFTYNPGTQGAISSITASVNKNIFITVAGGSNTFHPLIKQDGNFYIASIPGAAIGSVGFTGYSLFSGTLTAASFDEYNFVTGVTTLVNPNFNGDAMVFGLAQISGNGSGFESLTAYYDNLSYDITPSKTPEPASFSLLGLGLLGIVTLASRKMLLHS
jgi:hypothetical protein